MRSKTRSASSPDPLYHPDRYYYTHAISDNAAMFVSDHKKAHADKPFFMYIAYTAAHWPMHALPEDIAKYKGNYDAGYETIRKARYERMKKMGLIKDEWGLSQEPRPWSEVPGDQRAWELRCMEVYAAMVDSMDQGIGKLVETLKATGQYDNTLILFFQDNGGCAENRGRQPLKRPLTGIVPMVRDELQTKMVPDRSRAGLPVLTGTDVMPGPAETYIAYGESWANVSNTPFRYYKSNNHEGGVATPLIAHWTDGIRAKNELRHQPGHLIDIMPMEGMSLVPSFAKDISKDRLLMWEHYGSRAIRKDKWKLVALRRNSPWELYDMEADRSELHDLSEKFPEKAKELAEIWEQEARRTLIYPKPAHSKP